MGAVEVVLNLSPELAVILGPEGGILEANEAFIALVGHWPDSLVDLIHEEDRAAVAAALQDQASCRQRCRLRDADGAWRTVEWRFGRHDSLLYGFGRDETEALRRAALAERHERVLLAIAGERPIAKILEMVCLAVEELIEGAACSVLLLSQDGTRLLHGAAPHLPEAYSALIDGLPIGPAVGSCGTAAYRGETVIVEDARSDPLWASYHEVVKTFSLRAIWSTPLILPNQGVVGTFAVYMARPYRPGDWDRDVIRQLTGAAAIALSQARIREGLRDSLAELVQREKLASLGQLVVGVAHEANTPIGIALTAVTTLRAALDRLKISIEAGTLKKSDLARFAEAIRAGVNLTEHNLKRAAELIRTFKQGAVDRTTGESRVVDVLAYLERVFDTLAEPLQAHGVSVAFEAEALPRLVLAPGPVAQICTALAENAIAHAFEGVAAPALRIIVSAPKPDRLAIAVEDNGRGMPPEVLAKAFDPFFTTRRGAGHMGLGLYIVHNLATGPLRGGIEVASEPGHGSRFTLTIPILRAGVAQAGPQRVAL